MTKKEHQRNLKRIAKAIEESRVLLRNAGVQVNDSQAQIQTNQKFVQSSKSGLEKTEIRMRAAN